MGYHRGDEGRRGTVNWEGDSKGYCSVHRHAEGVSNHTLHCFGSMTWLLQMQNNEHASCQRFTVGRDLNSSVLCAVQSNIFEECLAGDMVSSFRRKDMQRVMNRDKRCRRNWFQLLLKCRNFRAKGLLMLRRGHELLCLQAIKVMLESMEVLMPIVPCKSSECWIQREASKCC